MQRYDVEVNLGVPPGELGTTKRPYFGISRSTFFDGMVIRTFGNTKETILAMPPLVAGSFIVDNDGQGSVKVKRGGETHTVLPGDMGWFEMSGSSQVGLDQLVRVAAQRE